MNEKQLGELERLSALLNRGAITQKEFNTNKEVILGKTTYNIPTKPKKEATGYYWFFGIIGLIVIYFIYDDNTSKPNDNTRIIGQLREVYTKLCKENGHLRLLKIYTTQEDSYVVEIEVDETIQVANDTNTKEQNLKLTQKWTDLVDTPEVREVALTNNIFLLSVRQIGKKGEMHSIAIVD